MYGKKKSDICNSSDYQYTTTSSTDPTKPWYWVVTIHAPWQPSSTVSLAAYMKVIITYYILFTESDMTPVS